ncbi:MAG TPA: hypothetical protein PLL10_07175, partial [Elusimicrobiales bacterium]|nr:hypothetical protein [Elusimicrobiales bacterium]
MIFKKISTLGWDRLYKLLLFVAWGLLLSILFFKQRVSPVALSSVSLFSQFASFSNNVLDPGVSLMMPMTNLAQYLASYSPPGMEFLPQAIFSFLMALLLLGAGLSVESLCAGFLASVLFFLFIGVPVVGIYPELSTYIEDLLLVVFSTLVVLVLLLRAGEERRTWRSEVLVAVAIGASLMVKSPLVLLPAVLGLYDLLSGKLRRGETSWKLLGIVLTLPYLMLLPWIYMYWHLFGELIFLEHSRVEQNIISGALGVVYAMETGYYVNDSITNGANVWLWSVKTVLQNPAGYISSVLGRIWVVFTWYPALFVCSTAACLRFRKDS